MAASVENPVLAEGPSKPLKKQRASGSGLGRYVLVRFLLIIPTVWILTTLVFFLMRITGDPITAALGGRLTKAQLQERIEAAGYDRPLIVQYFEYMGGLLRGDFGTTVSDNRPVTDLFLQYGAATVELVFFALIVAFAVGIPLGMLAAYHRDRWPDAALRVFAILCYATPVILRRPAAQAGVRRAHPAVPGIRPCLQQHGAAHVRRGRPHPHLLHRRDPDRRLRRAGGHRVPRGAAGDRAGSADRRSVPPAGAHEPHRHTRPAVRRVPAARAE